MQKLYNHQLIQLILAHFKEIIREPAVLFWGILFPILMAWGLGIAFTSKPTIEREIVIIQSPDSVINSNSKLYKFLQPYFKTQDNHYYISLKNNKLGDTNLKFTLQNWDEAIRMLKKGKTSLLLQPVKDSTFYHFDRANSDAQLMYQLVSNIVNYGTGFYTERQEEIKPLTLKGTRYIDFLIPGLLAMGIMMSTCWGISYTVIDRRSKKLLRRMVATPMKKTNLLLALIFARFTMNIVEATILFFFAWLYFGIQIQGSLAALILIIVAGNMAFAGISILISSNTSNPEIGNGLINAVVTPMMVLSGVFFSYHYFPIWAQPVIENLPLTMVADNIRSIFNEGAGIADVWKATLILMAIGMVSFIGGLKLFKWY
jgi:ABC-type multidrug transport system permease subunit